MAGTNIGKSILLVNNAISSISGIGPDGTPGQNVLLITFELDTTKTAMRCMGAATKIALDDLLEHQEHARRIITQIKQTYNKRFAIYEWAPDECSVAHIYALLDNLRRVESFSPDVIIIDYMDLMVSRNSEYNKDDYTRQKHIANEIRGLAKNENVLVFTATQTNRSGAAGGEEMADMNKVAESYGKQFSLDYIVSLNQTRDQRRMEPPRITMYIAKNRNGPRAEQIECEINYNTMFVKEL
jgi:replicative DNA helicase